MSRVAGRYAKSLIELAQERGALQSVVADMNYLSEAAKNRDLANLLKSPIIAADKKLSVLNAIFGQFDEVTKGFVRLCVTKSRENILPQIASELLAQYKVMQGLTTIKITSATPLTDAEVEAIRAQFEKSSATLKTVEVETAINPALVGGFVVEFGDKLYDASVASKLKAMRSQFSTNLYDSKVEKHGTV